MASAAFARAQIARWIDSTVGQQLDQDRGESMTARRSTSGRFASVFVAALVAPTAAAANPAENDEAMIRAATRSGCMACHAILQTACRRSRRRGATSPSSTGTTPAHRSGSPASS
ncbi:MAG: hypothetical protein ABI781_21385, partial [Burkholderiales bacterium]